MSGKKRGSGQRIQHKKLRESSITKHVVQEQEKNPVDPVSAVLAIRAYSLRTIS
jgi:hypothetical protein